MSVEKGRTPTTQQSLVRQDKMDLIGEIGINEEPRIKKELQRSNTSVDGQKIRGASSRSRMQRKARLLSANLRGSQTGSRHDEGQTSRGRESKVQQQIA
ncbi:unnamed protein product [Sphagnum tenellum]